MGFISCDISCDMHMQSLQLWLPAFGASIKRSETGRDAMRAYELWQGEPLVWLLPEIRSPSRWEVRGLWNLAVPSEEFDRIDVIHVTEDGRLYAPSAERKLPKTVDGLLDAWLNVQKAGGASFVYPPRSVTVPVPEIDPMGKVSTGERTFTFNPGTYIPFTCSEASDQEGRKVMIWPPDGSPSPISPEAESAKRYPSKKAGTDPPMAITDKGDLALQVFLRWPRPVSSIMSLLSGPDDLLAQAQMLRIAGQSTSEHAESLRAAALGAQQYISLGYSTVEHSWFRPTLEEKGIEHVLFKAEDRGLTALLQGRRRWDRAALEQALKREDWQKWLGEPVSIRRAWGAAGLFWTLLRDRLENQELFATCERCGRLISGKDGKRFCARSDDLECFNNRRALDQRRSRRARSNARHM